MDSMSECYNSGTGMYDIKKDTIMTISVPTQKKNDMINHPAHYNYATIEPIDVIEDWQLPYHLGNSLKYIARAGHKEGNSEIQDLKKAIWYINRYIELKEGNN